MSIFPSNFLYSTDNIASNAAKTFWQDLDEFLFVGLIHDACGYVAI